MTIRNPVGPQPPSVYWRRRLLVLLGVVAVVVVIILIVVAPKGGSPSAADTLTPKPTSSTPNPDPSFTGSGSSAAAGNCDPSVITLTPITDAASYAANVQPKLSMSITNSGAKACTLDVGTKAQVYTITSGAETIWTSTDCQTNPQSDIQTLQPGKTLTTTPFAWDRARSSTSTCSATNPTPVTAGGASYHLGVKLGGISSSGTKQFLLQ